MSKVGLKDNFSGFMKHASDLSEAFEKLDNGNCARQTDTNGGRSRKDSTKSKVGTSKPAGQPSAGDEKSQGHLRPHAR